MCQEKLKTIQEKKTFDRKRKYQEAKTEVYLM